MTRSMICTPSRSVNGGTGFFGQRAQAMSRGERKAMIARDHPGLSLSRQCQVLAISRSSFYYAPKGESADNLALMRRIDELFMKHPFYGSIVRWSASCGGIVPTACGGPPPGAALDAPHGAGGALSSAENKRSPPGTPGLSLSSRGNGDRDAQPGLVRRHHLHPCPARLPLPGRYHGLGDPPCARLAAVEQHGCLLLHRGAG